MDYPGGPLAPPWLVPGDYLYKLEISSLMDGFLMQILQYILFSTQKLNILQYLCMRQQVTGTCKYVD